jgi:hypothetical protein
MCKAAFRSACDTKYRFRKPLMMEIFFTDSTVKRVTESRFTHSEVDFFQ